MFPAKQLDSPPSMSPGPTNMAFFMIIIPPGIPLILVFPDIAMGLSATQIPEEFNFLVAGLPTGVEMDMDAITPLAAVIVPGAPMGG